jgi:hypothetical protein
MVGMALSALALATAALILFAPRPLERSVPPLVFRDLGNLLLMTVMLWAYMSFAQFLIIWIADIGEEVPWYLRRLNGGWEWIGVALLAFHFFAPFLLLLFRGTKRRAGALLAVCGGLLFMRLVDLFWLTHPPFWERISFHWLDLAAPAGVGGAWLAVFLLRLRGKPLLPAPEAGGAEA